MWINTRYITFLPISTCFMWPTDNAWRSKVVRRGATTSEGYSAAGDGLLPLHRVERRPANGQQTILRERTM